MLQPTSFGRWAAATVCWPHSRSSPSCLRAPQRRPRSSGFSARCASRRGFSRNGCRSGSTRSCPRSCAKHAIDMWVVPMREYNEDPVFLAVTSPETFAARRRTIYVFFDKCAAAGAPPSAACVERIALGGSSQGGVFEARRSTQAAAGDVGRGRQAELWGDEQWQALVKLVEERKPKVIGIDRSTVFAFSDGLSSGELEGMSRALGETWTVALSQRRGPAARADRVAAARGGGLLPAHAGARVVAIAGDVLEPRDHAGQDAHERPRVVVAAARQRPRPRHLVPALRRRPAAGQDCRGAGRGPGDRARRRAALGPRHHRAAAEHRHAAPGLRAAAGRDGAARGPASRRSRTRTRCRTS